MDMGCPTLLELHFEAVELDTHWVALAQENLGDESLDSVLKVPRKMMIKKMFECLNVS